jgi:hypothetical protein
MLSNNPQAVRSPISYAGSGDSLARLSRLQSEFSKVLDASHVFVRLQGSEHFITGSPTDTLSFPSPHPRSGQARYEWHDRGDGVLYGCLINDENRLRV